MSAATLWRFARALGVEIQYFYEGLSGEPPPRLGA
jgi:hypothetical protein